MKIYFLPLLGLVVIAYFLLPPKISLAQRGCCSWHGGVAGCDTKTGRQICFDGTFSPSCGCAVVYTYGCTNSNALNFNPAANKDNGSCILPILGCMNPSAINFFGIANKDNGSCLFKQEGIEEEIIPFETTYEIDESLASNETKTKQMGENGVKNVKYLKVVDANGQEKDTTKREKISEEIVKEPTKEVLLQGEPEIMVDRDGIFWGLLIVFFITVVVKLARDRKIENK